MKKFTLFLFVTIWIIGCSTNKSQIPVKPYHHIDGGFRNPPGSIEYGGFSLMHIWFGFTRTFVPLYFPNIPDNYVLDPNEALEQFQNSLNHDSITWIGHMTSIIRLDKQVIAIDPWFTKWVGIYRRVVPPAIPLNRLPQINTILISHNHRDHLDIATLESIPNPDKIVIVVPLGVRQYIKHLQFKEIVELDWYQSKTISGINYTALPVVHWSGRTAFDNSETLWAGFAIESQKGKKVFFCEAEYGEIYKQLGKEYGPFDVALIAAGAYLPREVMKGSHCKPRDCVQIGLDLNAENLIPLHWGTVKLGMEDIFEGGRLFKQKAMEKGVPEERVWVLKIGETHIF